MVLQDYLLTRNYSAIRKLVVSGKDREGRLS